MPNHLSALELHGYKTFANETTFKLPGMVTAIVGPNGSGKSNIADAIRWVLGEQSYSLLRAKRTEDMIFSGSDQRSRAGLASVSITFNNEDNWLPIDYSEVVLTRRAYRNGQNEYLINNQKVRLKDFHELLASTGLGDRNYTIIGQGLVDVALAIRPDERRKLFEEAAGIGLYRERKEESIKRLDTTRRNLDRVLDIISEIRPRLRSLEKQAGKVAEYKRIQSDLQLNLREWYGYYWFKAQEELVGAKSNFKEQEKQIELLREKQSTNQDDLLNLGKDLQLKREQLNHFHAELGSLHSDSELHNLNLAVLEERERSFIGLIKNLEVEKISFEEGIRSKQEELLNANEELISQKLEFEEIRSQHISAVDALTKRISERKQHEILSDGIRKNLVTLETKSITLKAKKNELQNRIDEINTGVNQKSKNISALTTRVKGLLQKKSDLSSKLKEKQSSLDELKQIIFINQENILFSESEILKLKNKIEELSKEKTRLSVKLDMISRSEQALADFSAGAKSLLQSKKDHKIDLDLIVINKEIVVPEIYETAIASALGDAIDVLRVKVPRMELDIIQKIEDHSSGRVAIISKTEMAGNDGELISGQKDLIIGRASDLIKYPEDLADIIKALLGNVFIVPDKQIALELINKFPSESRFVTLDGDLFLGNGVIYLGKGESSNKIGLPRQKIELKELSDQILDNIKEISHSLDEKESKFTDFKEELSSLKETELQHLNEIKEINNSLITTDLEFSKVSEQIDWFTSQKLLDESRVNEFSEVLHSVGQDLQDTEKNTEELRKELETQSSLLSALPLDELQAAVYRLETDNAIAQQKFIHTETILSAIQKRITVDQEQLLNCNNKIQKSTSQFKEIQREKSEIHEKLEKINIQISELQSGKTKIIDKELQELEIKYQLIQSLDSTLQKEALLKERLFTQASLDLTLKNEKLESLKEHIEDDFGMVNYEYSQNIEGSSPLPFKDILIETLLQKFELPESLGETIKDLKNQLRKIGAINPEAQSEYEEVKQRFNFLSEQIKDLEKASTDLRRVIEELDILMVRDFVKTFKAVNLEFSHLFTRLFNGGSAKLTISDESDPIESGIEIEAKLPGKREQGLALLSGGERSLAAVALVFALLKVSPTPFCVLDEVDAMLDESNVGRFCDLLLELSKSTQFILITHNRTTVQVADVIYGVTMGRDSSTQVLSLRLDEVDQSYVE